MINKKKKMYAENTNNQPNASKLLSNIENPWWLWKCDLGFENLKNWLKILKNRKD